MNYQKIKIELELRNIPIKEFAKQLGISEQGFHRMIRKQSMKISTLLNISKLLKVDPKYWFKEEYVFKNGDTVIFVAEDKIKQYQKVSITDIRKLFGELYKLLKSKEDKLLL